MRVADGREGEAIATLRAVTRGRALLVVDYAETRVGLRQMLTTLASEDGRGVKVLLLARSAGDWWDQLGVEEPAVWDLVQAARSEELALSPVVDADLSDADVVAQAVTSFTWKLGLPDKVVEIYGDGGHRRRILDLHAAALIAVLNEPNTGTMRVDIRTVLKELLRHEQHFWYESARAYGLLGGPAGMSADMLRQLVAAGCLLGAATKQDAIELPRRVPGLSPSPTVAEWLRELYPPRPGEQDWLGLMQPDRLAELHTVQELVKSRELAEACLTNLDSRQARRVVTLLARASSDDPYAETLLSRTLPNIAGFIGDLEVPGETLIAIFNAIPYPTVILASAAVALGQSIIRLLPDDTQPEQRAYWSNILGIRFTAVGRPADALPFTQKAVDIYRELAADNPGHRPDLANSLHNLGIAYYELDRPTDALPVTQEATEIYRELAAVRPDPHRPNLARSLVRLCITFSLVGRSADALVAGCEAVEIYRELAADNPDYRPDLANSLHGLGLAYYELDRPTDALPVTQEAVEIRREVAAVSPDRYRPDLADSLAHLGICSSVLDDGPLNPLPVTQEAVEIRRELAAVSPDRYRPDLVRSLGNLGRLYFQLGSPADALLVTEEAIEILRDLVAASLDPRRLGFARLLDNLKGFSAIVERRIDATGI